MKNDSELQRIEADLAKARERAAQLRASAPPTAEANANGSGDGAPLAWHATKATAGIANGERQWHSQLAARVADIARLESELLLAMLAEGKVTASGVLAALDHRCTPSRLVVNAAAAPSAADPIRAKLQALLDGPRDTFIPGFIKRSTLEDLFK